jgi:UDP-glucose 4-epimerase
VTGGAGFVGASLVRALEARGDDVLVVDSLQMAGRSYLRGTEARILAADLGEPGVIEKAVDGVDSVIHLAAQTGVPASIEAPLDDLANNVVLTVRLLDAARRARIQRVIVASSNAAVGRVAEQPIGEQALPHPVAPYGAAKLAAEGYVMAYAESYGLAASAIRFSNSYGPYALHKVSVVAAFIKAYLAGRPLVVYGDGSQTRDFVHVDDLVAQLLLTLDAPPELVAGEIFQAGSGRETSVLTLAHTVLEIGGRTASIEHAPARHGDVARSYSDIRKAARILGYRPHVELEEGLTRTLAWFREALGDPDLVPLAAGAASGSD